MVCIFWAAICCRFQSASTNSKKGRHCSAFLLFKMLVHKQKMLDKICLKYTIKTNFNYVNIMVKVTLKQSSCRVDESCVMYCNRMANVFLDCDDSALFRVTTEDEVYHFVWMNPRLAFSEAPEYCPIFREENVDAICEIKKIEPVEVDDIFCHGGEAYYLSQNERGTLSVRRLNFYSSQEIVEKIAWYDDDPEPVLSVLLTKLYDMCGGRRFVMYAWQVKREHITEYMPVFDGEDRLFDELIPALTDKVPMVVGDVLGHEKHYWTLCSDINRKLYLSPTSNRLTLKGARQSVLHEAQREALKTPKTAKVFRMIPQHDR